MMINNFEKSHLDFVFGLKSNKEIKMYRIKRFKVALQHKYVVGLD